MKIKFLLTLAYLLVYSLPCLAITFNVNTTNDSDANLGDGICADSNGFCSIRAAIQEANQSNTEDQILIPTGTFGFTINGPEEDLAASGDLDILYPIVISGISKEQTVLLNLPSFFIFNNSNFTLENMTISNGGRAILDQNENSLLKIKNVAFLNNNIAGPGTVYKHGSLKIEGSSFVSNISSSNGGAIYFVCNAEKELSIRETQFSSNYSDTEGGAIYISCMDGIAEIIASNFTSNRAEIASGAIEAWKLAALTIKDTNFDMNSGLDYAGTLGLMHSGSTHISNSTITNSSADYGAGIYGWGDSTITLDNSTISSNSAWYDGGGIHVKSPITINNSTIVNNSATGFGSNLYSVATITVNNSIISEGLLSSNCNTTVSYSSNSIENGSSCGFIGVGDLSNTDPLIGDIADNGGKTKTHTLLPSSPAIDSGNNQTCLVFDQRGANRPIDGDNNGSARCDIGAVELGDLCLEDPDKIDPGICGCGIADTDADNDGIVDCNDECENDPNKVDLGICGCGIADTDADNDGVVDCNDECENDPNKVDPGICGCGIADIDSDLDGTLDCEEECPNDANKTEAGICGCGIADLDDDNNGIIDCLLEDTILENAKKILEGLKKTKKKATLNKLLKLSDSLIDLSTELGNNEILLQAKKIKRIIRKVKFLKNYSHRKKEFRKLKRKALKRVTKFSELLI